MIIAGIATGVVRRLAPKLGLVDQPSARKVHVIPTPLGGGIGIWLGLVIPFAIAQLLVWYGATHPEMHFGWPLLEKGWQFVQPHLAGYLTKSVSLWILLGLATVLATVGLLDDLLGLGWKIRLAIQFIVAGVVVWGLGWKLSFFIAIPVIPDIVTVFWIVALINSFNMLDNMDGLSAGIAGIGSFMLASVLLLAPDPTTAGPQLFVGGFLLALTGSILGFLYHNRPPAKIFMGDAGSYLIGFCMAVMTILATFGSYEENSQHAILAPLCILAVPLYDLVTVLYIRIRQGRSPFQPDKCHFSHRLVEMGFSKTSAVMVIYLLTATCGLGALLLHRVDRIGAVLVLLLVFCVLCLIALIELASRRKERDRTE
ncbi:undecaprenyl/decaprenyl-phosphate alpha-N-acetylglucosaminyl 1-phosphate transferase [Blastopirellula marina]|uniref:Undecaprenyl/decaprenyl-phosphate alpha-N-acetylglucosaminyl 1-phosphate transferase n=2 Tax=Blastopirellula marina TaxID=124 RepID=A0A2S8GEJ7_9BACT|nr:undecaprenyl/decaprenyl-phosphate alpha-N-acetylglucosaminyl 1-phosphate transferase [Blastopirellula marina]PTL46643.1 undecaprenyl/decaprenyl-phosphate alpha-N-acetylglucosaminyl 1-phosphate transferase [Blastopirellula marina]